MLTELPILNFDDKSLKNFFYNNYQPMLITDPEITGVFEINEAGAEAFKHERADIIARFVEEIIPEKEYQKLLQLSASAGRQKPSSKKEICLINGNGKSMFFETAMFAVLYAGKEARMVTLSNVTEKRLYRQMLEEAIEEEIDLKVKNRELKKIAYNNFHLARKPLANILGLISLLDESAISDQTLSGAIDFLRESSNQLDQLIKGIDPQLY